ncbi:hypothetical protein [Nonomuraea cavernae]|nr:hypothetical protein [Nonomuraea cavernae]MCA2183790.1 hypothetical protein [Nonomuraea cavernae]
MGRSWQVPRRSTAFSVAVGLLVLSMFLTVSTPAWAGGDPSRRWADPIGSGDWIAQSSSMPSAFAGAREHLPSLWPPLRRGSRPEAPRLPLPAATGADTGSIRSPQQFAYRSADSRSPPLI